MRSSRLATTVGNDLFVVGHGIQLHEHVYVPAGVRVHFYAEKRRKLPMTLGVAAINSGGWTAPMWSVGRTGWGSRCRNVVISRLSDAERQVMESAASTTAVLFAGDPSIPVPSGGLALCETPSACRSSRRHDCGGWLDVMRSWGTVLHVVACIAQDDDAGHTVRTGRDRAANRSRWRQALLSWRLPARVSLLEDVHELITRFEALSWREKENLFDSLPSATQAILRSTRPVDEWAVLRGARTVLHDAGAMSLRAYLDTLGQDERACCRQDPDLVRAADEATAWVERWSDPASARPEQAAAAWAALDPLDRTGVDQTQPDIALRMAGWSGLFPEGLTEHRAARLLDEHNAAVLAATEPGDVTSCVEVGERVVLAPAVIVVERDANGFETGTGGALRRHVRRHGGARSSLTAVHEPGGRWVLSGQAAQTHGWYLRMMLRRAKPEADLPPAAAVTEGLDSFHEDHLLRAVNASVLRQVHELNALTSGPWTAATLRRAVTAVEDELASRTKLAEALGSWSAEALAVIRAWWSEAAWATDALARACRGWQQGAPDELLRLPVSLVTEMSLTMTAGFLLSDHLVAVSEQTGQVIAELRTAWTRVCLALNADADLAEPMAELADACLRWTEVVPTVVGLVVTELELVPAAMTRAVREGFELADRLLLVAVPAAD
ncbi:putative adhesin [Lentzea sp. E54]|uniref:putative adhesin n=1 Tax=Lentzea xerophila TaxID=3435883 RepID=UPI003DA490E7